jgi:hypothetical protein
MQSSVTVSKDNIIFSVQRSPKSSNYVVLINVTDWVSYACNSTGKYVDTYVLILRYLHRKLKDKCFKLKEVFPEFNLLLIYLPLSRVAQSV